jgi:hypothetical protein
MSGISTAIASTSAITWPLSVWKKASHSDSWNFGLNSTPSIFEMGGPSQIGILAGAILFFKKVERRYVLE